MRPVCFFVTVRAVIFQSTHPRGMRHSMHQTLIDRLEFQSTHPRGMRRNPIKSSEFMLNFNPRIRVGCDRLSTKITIAIDISIHASAWDATFFLFFFNSQEHYFNPRIRVGCDIVSVYDFINDAISIHASAWDATILAKYPVKGLSISIHASAWDAT